MIDTGPLKDDEFDFQAYTAEEAGQELDVFDLARAYLDTDSDSDPSSNSKQKKRTAIIRTSDRIAFRDCRRKWNWSHSARGNLQSNKQSSPFWLGTGMHFALEDYHGYHNYTYPRDALHAYYRATSKTGFVPDDVDELLDLGQHMLDYYEQWLEHRQKLQTLIIDGKPQVEVVVHIEIPKEHLSRYCRPEVLDLYDRVIYSMTLDRVIIDEYRRLWIVEYKSAKMFQWMHLDTDNQVTAYRWGTAIKYPGYEIAGTVYQQHRKQILQPPAFLSSTKKFSTSKRQKTSYALYLSALRNLYGNDFNIYPPENRQFLEFLKTQESDRADELIKRDYVERNQHQADSEYQKILMEASEMLDPRLLIYPNPTRDCSWKCSFNGACVAYDCGEDWQAHISEQTISRTAPEINWRKYLQ